MVMISLIGYLAGQVNFQRNALYPFSFLSGERLHEVFEGLEFLNIEEREKIESGEDEKQKRRERRGMVRRVL